MIRCASIWHICIVRDALTAAVQTNKTADQMYALLPTRVDDNISNIIVKERYGEQLAKMSRG